MLPGESKKTKKFHNKRTVEQSLQMLKNHLNLKKKKKKKRSQSKIFPEKKRDMKKYAHAGIIAYFLYQVLKDLKEEMAYLVNEAMQDIESFKAHHMRPINQEKSLTEILNELSNEKMLIHQDWGMKFLPKKY